MANGGRDLEGKIVEKAPKTFPRPDLTSHGWARGVSERDLEGIQIQPFVSHGDITEVERNPNQLATQGHRSQARCKFSSGQLAHKIIMEPGYTEL